MSFTGFTGFTIFSSSGDFFFSNWVGWLELSEAPRSIPEHSEAFRSFPKLTEAFRSFGKPHPTDAIRKKIPELEKIVKPVNPVKLILKIVKVKKHIRKSILFL